MIESRLSFNYESDQRIKALAIFTSLAFLSLIGRLFHLQILRGTELHRLAEQNRTQIIPLMAPRGYIKDRHNEILLDNAPRFSLFYSNYLASSHDNQNIAQQLIKFFPHAQKAIQQKIKEARKTGKMTRIITDIPRNTAMVIIEKRLTLPGVNVVVEPKRRSRYGALASHIIGYVNEINPVELNKLRDHGYSMGQLIGKTGIEQIQDKYLRGRDGGLQFETDASGHHVQVMHRISSLSGADITLTIDRRLQQVIEKRLAKTTTKRGAAIVVDPRTGAILAAASSPHYDPTDDPAKNLHNPDLPFFTRMIQGNYPPGSIFKIVTSAAALQADWDTTKTFYCPGKFRLGNKEFACWKTHRKQDFMGAVAWSCNVYFYNMALQIGPDPIEQMARQFGYGQKTDINLPSESPGLIPGRAWKQTNTDGLWYRGDTINFCIGQGDVLVTPMQAAMMVAAVANKGTLWKPYLIERITTTTGDILYQEHPQERAQITLVPEIWQTLHTAMQGVVTEGTGQRVKRPDLIVGAKTGTAQNPHGDDHAWFVTYAGLPDEPATLALAVFVENGGMGSRAAGPIARAIVNTVFPKDKKRTIKKRSPQG